MSLKGKLEVARGGDGTSRFGAKGNRFKKESYIQSIDPISTEEEKPKKAKVAKPKKEKVVKPKKEKVVKPKKEK